MSIQPIFESKSFELIVAMYKIMEHEAYAGDDEDFPAPYGDPDLEVWEGFQSDLGKRIDISAPYTSRLVRDMEKMGCIEIIERGFRGTRSKYVLRKDPTQQDFINRNVVAEREAVKRSRELASVVDHEQRIKALEQMVSEMWFVLKERGMISEDSG
jgi:DNA-binding MarR family transcriptional regulator